MKYCFDKIYRRDRTNSVKYDLRSKFFGDSEVLPLWVADMDFRVAEEIRLAIADRAADPVYGYTFWGSEGKKAFVDWVGKRHGWAVSENHLSFSPGVVPALSFLMSALTEEGDKVLIQPPVYHPFKEVVGTNGRALVNNPLVLRDGRYYMDFDGLESEFADGVRMMFLCNPHNPSGRMWEAAELAKVADLAKKYGVIVVSDEIHSDLALKGRKHIPYLSVADEGIVCMAPSKTFNLAGLSSSVLVIPDAQQKLLFEKELRKFHISGNLFGFEAMDAAYKHGESWLAQVLEYIEGNVEFMAEYISEYMPAIKMMEPEASYLVWLDCTGLGLDAVALNDLIVKDARLGLNDGRMFGAGGKGYQRVNVACPRAVVVQAMDRLYKALEAKGLLS
ncbi:aminotransferase [Fulvitalea axinellae]|uniref:cysteine-S-conjugate beta-lyase n=1 Tax=Fulvitalea axinellae TaxID=1182444 RepID=A0AAU9CM60_9BACT|nr:aminotransferase [Fulvitalea axinellae]